MRIAAAVPPLRAGWNHREPILSLSLLLNVADFASKTTCFIPLVDQHDPVRFAASQLHSRQCAPAVASIASAVKSDNSVGDEHFRVSLSALGTGHEDWAFRAQRLHLSRFEKTSAKSRRLAHRFVMRRHQRLARRRSRGGLARSQSDCDRENARLRRGDFSAQIWDCMRIGTVRDIVSQTRFVSGRVPRLGGVCAVGQTYPWPVDHDCLSRRRRGTTS